jgi:hypothetical protein
VVFFYAYHFWYSLLRNQYKKIIKTPFIGSFIRILVESDFLNLEILAKKIKILTFIQPNFTRSPSRIIK